MLEGQWWERRTAHYLNIVYLCCFHAAVHICTRERRSAVLIARDEATRWVAWKGRPGLSGTHYGGLEVPARRIELSERSDLVMAKACIIYHDAARSSDWDSKSEDRSE